MARNCAVELSEFPKWHVSASSENMIRHGKPGKQESSDKSANVSMYSMTDRQVTHQCHR